MLEANEVTGHHFLLDEYKSSRVHDTDTPVFVNVSVRTQAPPGKAEALIFRI
jgi:hypothetical protein